MSGFGQASDTGNGVSQAPFWTYKEIWDGESCIQVVTVGEEFKLLSSRSRRQAAGSVQRVKVKNAIEDLTVDRRAPPQCHLVLRMGKRMFNGSWKSCLRKRS